MIQDHVDLVFNMIQDHDMVLCHTEDKVFDMIQDHVDLVSSMINTMLSFFHYYTRPCRPCLQYDAKPCRSFLGLIQNHNDIDDCFQDDTRPC